MMYRIAPIVLILAVLFTPSLSAQDVAFEGTLPDTVVVTASRLAEDTRTTGRRVSVWTARDLERLPVTSFDELLRTVGGVEAHSRGGFGVQSDLTIRGSTFNGVLVLLDDARLNDPMTGHFLADFPVPLSEIARIEVLRGPATALYGPDAIGGVIQLFTDAGLRGRAAPASGMEGRAEAMFGQHALYGVDVSARHAGERALLGAAVAVQGTEGQPIYNEQGQPVHSSEGPVRTDFQRQAASAALNRDVGRTTLYTRVGADNRDFGAFQFYSSAPVDTAREATTTLWAQARLAGDPSATNRWQVHLSARQHDDTFVFNPVTPANRHTSRQATADARLTRSIAPTWRVTGGASAQLRGMESNNMGRHQDASAGVYVTSRWQPSRRLTVTASGRVDADPGYGMEATPQASLAYNVQALTLRGGVSRAVRAPNYVERYFNTELDDLRGRDLGNPDLRAERAWAYEAGVDLYPTAGLSLHVTAFQRDTQDLIDFAMSAPEDTVFLAQNLHETRTRGLELDAEAHREIAPATFLRYGATYTLLEADLGAVEEGVTYKYALTNARHLLQTAAHIDVGRTSAGLQVLWKDPLAGDPYHIVHVRVGHRLSLGSQNLTLSGEVRNLFDLEYAEIFNAPMPRRWWLVGVQLSF